MAADSLALSSARSEGLPKVNSSLKGFISLSSPLLARAPPPVAYGYGANVDTPTKLYISNLDYAVSNEDIKELFSELGDIKRYSINYDKSGRSKGTAEVVFSTRSNALAAVKKYNNVHLDGKPMKIELIGTNIETPLPLPPPAIFGFAAPAAYFRVEEDGFGAGVDLVGMVGGMWVAGEGRETLEVGRENAK
uniref:RRM domain-containing protein n=1 Tax=Leersia perrieri TaxID=77586 RepID=A0A0D9XVZ5_9ORYZ